jgi:hypothetical protein
MQQKMLLSIMVRDGTTYMEKGAVATLEVYNVLVPYLMYRRFAPIDLMEKNYF